LIGEQCFDELALSGTEAIMKKSKRPPRGPGPRRPVQIFACGPFEFHVNKALLLAGNAAKYRPERRWPEPQWVGPFIDVDPAYIEQADLSKPVLFATLITDGRPWHLMIDGNHRVLKALRHRLPIEAIDLDLADTLKVIRGPAHALEQMRRDGERLGVLPGKHLPPGGSPGEEPRGSANRR
jgi:hypothetical protein